MSHIEDLKFVDFLNKIDLSAVYSFQQQVVFIDVHDMPSTSPNVKRLPLKIEAIMFLIVEKGELKMNVDYIPYTIKANSLIILSQRHVIQILSVSKDFKGYFIIAKPNYLRSLIDNERPPMRDSFQLITPIFSLTEVEFEIMKDCLKRLKWNIQREDHPYQKKMVEQCLAELVFEIWTFRSLNLKKDLDSSVTRNHENIAKEFFKLLLNNKIKERDVVFYANKLHVTPVYLSRAVKSVMGIPALQLIHNIILSESELLLRRKEMTIQQIAEELNFPDQATFSKFFKKHIGLSPIKYRKLNLV